MNKYKIEIKWAFIYVAMVLLWMLLERLTGLHSEAIKMHLIYTNFIVLPSIAIYVLALKDKRKNYYQGIFTYKQGFVTGLIISVFVTILSPLTQYIISTIISPDYFANVIKYAVSVGKMTQEAAENYFNLKSYIFQGLIGAPIMGLLTSSIVAIFTRRKAIKK